MSDFQRGPERCWRRGGAAVMLTLLLTPHLLLLLLSAGSGWSFPRLLPDRLDGGPWRHLLGYSGLLPAAITGAGLSLLSGVMSTLSGLLISRSIRVSCGAMRRLSRALLLLPFVISPVVAGVCLFDLAARTGFAGRALGVLLGHMLFGTATAAVILTDGWSDLTDRQEQLVRSFGGGAVAVWRHAILPRMRGLLLICLLQTSLLSWLDYGIVLQIGGGRVQTLTLRLFSLIRESSVNQAALAGLLLLLPVLPAALLILAALSTRSVSEQAR